MLYIDVCYLYVIDFKKFNNKIQEKNQFNHYHDIVWAIMNYPKQKYNIIKYINSSYIKE